jgi:tRNA(Ile2) C34 agmatinyltransferase TiaS
MRVTRLIPMCCSQPMIQIGEGKGRKRYYRCKECENTANGMTTRENLP